VATTTPAHQAILAHPDFAAGKHSTKWVEERLDLSGISTAPSAPRDSDGDREVPVERSVDVEVDGRRFNVKVFIPESQLMATGASPAARRRRPSSATGQGASGAPGAGRVTVPMQGTIVKVLVAVGDVVEVGQTICVLEAMKMENSVVAEKAGTITEIKVEPGETVSAGDIVATIE
jgi:acetyl-CoA/propionyl-CoA carboxylase biotin carboxyl carrier protein